MFVLSNDKILCLELGIKIKIFAGVRSEIAFQANFGNPITST